MKNGSRGKAAIPTPAITPTVRPPSGAWGQNARGRGVGRGQNMEKAKVDDIPMAPECNGTETSDKESSTTHDSLTATHDSASSKMEDKATENEEMKVFEEVQQLFTSVNKDERHIWRDLLQLVCDEAKSGSVRTRWSILMTIAKLNEPDLNSLIELYEEATRPKQTLVEDPPVAQTASTGSAHAETTSTGSAHAEDRAVPPPGLGLPSNPSGIPPGLGPPPVMPPPQLPPPPVVAPAPPPLPSAPPEPAPYVSTQVEEDVPTSATSPSAAAEHMQSSPGSPPAIPQPQRPKAPLERLTNDKLGDWLRRRVFELRIPLSDLEIGVDNLQTILQSLDDSQPVLPQVKMWIGLEEKEDMHPALARLVQEFAAARKPS